MGLPLTRCGLRLLCQCHWLGELSARPPPMWQAGLSAWLPRVSAETPRETVALGRATRLCLSPGFLQHASTSST